jgi:hypothetical protein
MEPALEDMAVRLAERIAPDEVELAPAIAEAALKGGREWQAVISPSSGAMLGGAVPGVESVGDFATILAVLKDCSGILGSFVTMVSTVLTIHLNWLALRDRPTREGEAAQLPRHQREAVRSTTEALTSKLEQRGLDSGRADEVVALLMHSFQESPEVAERLLRALGARK